MRRRQLLLVMVLLAMTSTSAFANHPSPLPDVVNTPNFNYHVRFSNDNPYNPASPQPGDDLNFIAQAQAQRIADALNNSTAATPGNPNGYHNGYTNLGFLAPDFDGSDRDVFVYDCGPHGGCDNAQAGADDITFHAPLAAMSTDACLDKRSGHELFHHVQYAYITFGKWSTWGSMPVEGTARMMEDKIFSAQDTGACTVAAYLPEVNDYLGNPNRTIWDISYTSALFWNYLSEQLGATTAEPQVGADFIRAFWENAQDNNDSPDTVATMRQTIGQFNLDRTLEGVFRDFTIANYAKDLDVAALNDAARYRYIDENDGNAIAYDQVAVTWSGNVPPAKGPQADSVVRWGARYYEATPGPDCRGVFGFRSTGDSAAYGLIAVKGTNKVDRIARGVGDTFARAFMQRSASPYTRLVAVVSGQNDAANYSYSFACGAAKVEILRPTAAYLAHVGPPEAPERFLVRMRVSGPSELGDPTVEGLDPADFEVYVGPVGAANRAPVISGAQVQGEYWLVAQAPAKGPGVGPYDLNVRLGDVSAAQQSAVAYDVFHLDQMLVLDRSGSMLAPASLPKLTAAQNAATLFVDSSRSDDKVGVVSFGGDNVEPNVDALLEAQLQDASDGHRTLARNKINGLSTTPNVLTSIGDGLDEARKEFPIRGSALGEDWIVLLSDGMENEAAFWNTIKGSIIGAGIKVNAIALGPYTDQALLQAIATETGGSYYYVDVPSGALAALRAGGAGMTLAALGDLPNLLGDAYATSAEDLQRRERIWEVSGALGAGGSVSYPIEVKQGGITDGLFSFNWADPGTTLGVTIKRPNGSTVANGVAGARVFTTGTHVVAHVGTLAPGTWTVTLSGAAGAPSYIGSLSGRDRQGAQLKLYFAQDHNEGRASAQNGVFLRGLPMPVLASLTDGKGPVLGADLLATVEHPDGTTIKLPLLDDGDHGDGAADDGIYGNRYTRTTAFSRGSQNAPEDQSQQIATRGSYNVRLEARGEDNLGGTFSRIRKGSFQIFELVEPKPDADGDDMPDRYEALHACLDAAKVDTGGDPDDDGLNTGEEWKAGTDPCHPDTDRGGESDRSELGRGANPFDPRDDALPRPVYVEVIATMPDHQPDFELRAGANLVHYPVSLAYAKVRVLRGTNPAGPFAQVAEFDARAHDGLYFDEGLSNGTTYYYKVVGIDLNGNTSAPSPVFSGTPKADPKSPLGNVWINNDNPLTTNANVTLRLIADPDTTQVLISNDSSFAGASWQPYTPTRAWTLAPPSIPGVATVYVKYRDSELNETPVYNDSIKVVPPLSLGSILGKITLFKLGAKKGVLIKVVRSGAIQLLATGDPATQIPPTYTRADGGFTLTDLPPGTYDLLAEYPGYERALIRVSVRAGAVTDAGNTNLPFIKTFLPFVRR